MNLDESSRPPARRLLLMRHAKSDWADESLSDHDRPLNRRGQRDAPRMADWLQSTDSIPDLILCSSAQRTQQTVALMNQRWATPAPVMVNNELYLASPETMFSNVRADGGDATTLLVVAHNPGIAQLVSLLSDQPTEMPTAAIAVFDIIVDRWDELSSPGQVEYSRWMKPKALPA